MDEWKVVHRQHKHKLRTGQKVDEDSPQAEKLNKGDIVGRVLDVVTRDGKKFTFPAPDKKSDKQAEQKTA